MSPFRDAPSRIWPGDPGWASYLALRIIAADARERSEEQLEVTVYAGARCVRCWRVKRLLRRRSYAFEVIGVSSDDELRIWLVEATGSKTVPQVFVGGRLVGGFDEVRALDLSGDLERLVRGEV